MADGQMYVALLIAFGALVIFILFSFIVKPINVVDLGEQAISGTVGVAKEVASVGTDLAEPVTTQVKAPSGFIESFDLNAKGIHVRNKRAFFVDISSVTVGSIRYDCTVVSIPPEAVRILTPTVCPFLNFKVGDSVVVTGSGSFRVSGVA